METTNKYLSMSIEQLNSIDRGDLSQAALILLDEAIKEKSKSNKKMLFTETELQKLVSTGVVNTPSVPYTEEQDGDYILKVISKHVTKGARKRVVICGESIPQIPNRDTKKEAEGLTLNNLLILKQLYEGITLSFTIKEVQFNDGSVRRFASNFEVVE